ncbi:MAG: DUF4843 domain-containing protein [Coprobacter sp.]|nr:DUF4843 domain-containing protein [Coprobacter sp.]
MKVIYRFLVASCALFALVACQQNEVMDYALDARVYFNETTGSGTLEKNIWTMNYSFALQKSTLTQDTIKLKVKLMGNVVDYDRVFEAEVLADSTTAQSGTHYDLLPGVLKAGTYESYLPVVLYRTEDTQEQSVSLYLRLSVTNDLAPGNPDAINFSLHWADMLMRPAHWPEYYFGEYSVNKYRFAIDVTGHTDWEQAPRVTTGKQEGIYTITEIQREADKLNDAYAEYRKTNGPIYVDDNADPLVEIYYGSK